MLWPDPEKFVENDGYLAVGLAVAGLIAVLAMERLARKRETGAEAVR